MLENAPVESITCPDWLSGEIDFETDFKIDFKIDFGGLRGIA